jgi:hypothetical protein
VVALIAELTEGALLASWLPSVPKRDSYTASLVLLFDVSSTSEKVFNILFLLFVFFISSF